MYFFDSYAILEIIKGNVSYEKYKTDTPICTIFNLVEVHQALLRLFNKQTADYWVNKCDYVLLDITKEDIISASDFRFENRKRKLSSIDCIEYSLAKRNDLKFLTGDKEFENMEGVEFVK